MPSLGELIFNNVDASDLGIRVWSSPSVRIPEKRVETIELPGRNGDVVIDPGVYKNVERSYKVSIYKLDQNGAPLPFHELYANLTRFLHGTNGYCKLEDKYSPGVYRLAYVKNEAEVANLLETVGVADIVFNCKPQVFYSGNSAVSADVEDGDGWLKPTIEKTISVMGINWDKIFYPTDSIVTLKCLASGSGVSASVGFQGDVIMQQAGQPDQKITFGKKLEPGSTIVLNGEMLTVTDDSGYYTEANNMGDYITVDSDFFELKPTTIRTFRFVPDPNAYEGTARNRTIHLNFKIEPKIWRL